MTWEDDDRTAAPLLLGTAALGLGVVLAGLAGAVIIVRSLRRGA